jgi:hypothetical protein
MPVMADPSTSVATTPQITSSTITPPTTTTTRPAVDEKKPVFGAAAVGFAGPCRPLWSLVSDKSRPSC